MFRLKVITTEKKDHHLELLFNTQLRGEVGVNPHSSIVMILLSFNVPYIKYVDTNIII